MFFFLNLFLLISLIVRNAQNESHPRYWLLRFYNWLQVDETPPKKVIQSLKSSIER